MKTFHTIIMACLTIATATCTATAQSISLGHTTPASNTAYVGGLSYTYSIGQIGRLVITKPQSSTETDNGSKAKAPNSKQTVKATAYPNPCTEYLKIKTGDKSSTNARIQIIDSKGSTIINSETTSCDSGDFIIDFSNIAQGSYIIRITTENCIYTATAIKI